MLAFFLLLVMPPPQAEVRFVDVARQAGLDFQHVSGNPEKPYSLETIGGGVAWIDYDKDGWPDLYLVNGGRWDELQENRSTAANALFRNNRDGTFTEVTRQARVGDRSWGMGAVAADFDNDGWTDLFLSNYGPNVLYRNRGDGSFEDVTETADVAGKDWTSNVAVADYDGDGLLDIYVVNYVEFDHLQAPNPTCQYRGMTVHCGPAGMKAAPDELYRNLGKGRFSRVALSPAEAAYGLGAAWADFDNDGDPDLFVANDSTPNFFYENQGEGRLVEIGLLSGLAYNEDGKAQAGMGVATGDYDHDGLLDLYVTHFSDDYNTLYRNRGGLIFQDVTYRAELAFPTWQKLAWGTFFLDVDHDGWEDLFVANGHIYPQVDDVEIGTAFRQSNQLFRNRANGSFQEWKIASLDEAWSSRGAAHCDYDNDGDLDIAVNNLDAAPTLLRNELSGNRHWVSLLLEGDPSNLSAVGTRVAVNAASTRQIREVQAGGSYQAGNDLRIHFGVGADRRIARIEVRWPDGRKQNFEDVEADRHYRLKQGGRLEQQPSVQGLEPGGKAGNHIMSTDSDR